MVQGHAGANDLSSDGLMVLCCNAGSCHMGVIVFPICQAMVTPLRQASDYCMEEQRPQREINTAFIDDSSSAGHMKRIKSIASAAEAAPIVPSEYSL